MSILISLIGLLGMAMVHLNQRVKELAIRKVPGAGLADITVLTMRNFTIPVGCALLMGIPLSVWSFNWWISAYYIYHIPISWHYLVIPAVFLPLMASLVICYR